MRLVRAVPKGRRRPRDVHINEEGESHNMTQQQVWSNLTYLLSESWVVEEAVEKKVPLRSGTIIPQATPFLDSLHAASTRSKGPANSQ